MDIRKDGWYVCQHCRRLPVSGIWLVTWKTGKSKPRLLCAQCGMSVFPQMNTVERITILQCLSRSATKPGECDAGLVPTGQGRMLKSLAGDLLGVFIEMRCPTCGYVTDVATRHVTKARTSYTHPNLL